MASDAPRGPKADKIWANALRLAVMRETEDENGVKSNYLTRIAQNMVKKATEGDVMAMKEIGDRLDGKPHQAIENTGSLTVYLAKPDESFT
jgi:predicted ATP-dependent Lon-type protease